MTQQELLDLLAKHNLKVEDTHRGAGKFKDLYIGMGQPRSVLQAFITEFQQLSRVQIGLTHVDNPEHADYGKIMVEIKSWWWE